MKKSKEQDVVIDKQMPKLGTKEICIGLVIIVIAIFAFNSTKFKDIIGNKQYGYQHADNNSEYQEFEDYNESVYEELKEFKGRLDCFNVKVVKNEHEEVFAVLESTSNIPLTDLEFYIIFYDGEKRPISIEKQYVDCIFPDGKWAGKLYNVNPNYETYDFLIQADNRNVKETVELFKNIKVSRVLNSSTDMFVRFENNAKKKVNSGAVAIYYDSNGNIMEIEKFYIFDLKPNKVEETKSYEFLRYQQDGYSNVEIILTDAYSNE